MIDWRAAAQRLLPAMPPALAVPLLFALLFAAPAHAGNPRDIVFECPCEAEWAPAGAGAGGTLSFTFGLRSHRATDSGELGLRPLFSYRQTGGGTLFLNFDHDIQYLVPVAAKAVLAGQRIAVETPSDFDPRLPIQINMAEMSFGIREDHPLFDGWETQLGLETLTLWPVPGVGAPGAQRFADLLTDSDGDGVGDANEVLAGTAPADPADTPGTSTVDVVALYGGAYRDAHDGDPFTRLHHLLTLTRAIFADSGTNMRLRTVGMLEVDWDERGELQNVGELMDGVGADLSLAFYADAEKNPCGGAPGCAFVGSLIDRGLWSYEDARILDSAGAVTAAHELGHVAGLAHSARQGEAHGSFRWSRGHYVVTEGGASSGHGTVMAYGVEVLNGVFSSPSRDCGGAPCGVPADEPGGADAAGSLDRIRFQIAHHRPARPDSDGDGFVDAVDAAPDDPGDWLDSDGDGLGDNADPDADGDGVADIEDAFPLDPGEWADIDGDGVGDNADGEVLDLSPFRDAGLRAAVEAALGKPPGAPIGAGELAALRELDGDGREIRNLAGLQLAVNLAELSLEQNRISDLSPLSGLRNLRRLDLGSNAVADLSPLGALTDLQRLSLGDNNIADLSALSGLGGLRRLELAQNAITDLAPLGALTGLQELFLALNNLSDLSPLSALGSLRSLDITANAITDLAPLGALTDLRSLYLSGNKVSDLSVLAGLMDLWRLELEWNPIDDLSPLGGLRKLRGLGIGGPRQRPLLDQVRALPRFRDLGELSLEDFGDGLADLSFLRALREPRRLSLRGNAIADLSPLAEFNGLRYLNLSSNSVADIGPLVRRSLWESEDGSIAAVNLILYRNPLEETTVNEHIPTLRGWGLNVYLPEPYEPVEIADPILRALIAQQRAGESVYIDTPITEALILDLDTLHAFNAGLTVLDGLEAAANLEVLQLGSNAVRDLAPLAGLRGLRALDLSGNRVADLAPLVANPGLGAGDRLGLSGNPLGEASLNEHVPALLARGVELSLESVALVLPAAGAPASFAVSGYFGAVLGGAFSAAASVDDPGLLEASVAGGRLRVVPGGRPGAARVTVTARGAGGRTAKLVFAVAMRGASAADLVLMPRAADAVRQGFVRLVNRSAAAGPVAVTAVDDAGAARRTAVGRLGAGGALHFNSGDLEAGNAAKGLAAGTGPGRGDWRLRLESALDLEALSYVRTRDGFLTAMHDLVPDGGAGHRVPTFNPASNRDQVSLLRLANPGGRAAAVEISGVDDRGASPGGPVRLELGPGAARTLSAVELEGGGAGLAGALGDGSGKWRLRVSADRPVLVASLLRSPTGHLANLSGAPRNLADGAGGAAVHHVPLFLAASDARGRQGFVRVINRGDRAAAVRVRAQDDGGRPAVETGLRLAAGAAAHFNSRDLESGNAGKGIAGVGAGDGDWRLELESDVEIAVLAYVRAADGFLTGMHDTAPAAAGGYRVPTFNPASNRDQVSLLRLVNHGGADAAVTIRGVDDRGAAGAGEVRLTVPAGRARTLSAAELEDGGAGLRGRLGDGAGKWRLAVATDRPLWVMSLLESPTGHLANLSTVPAASAESAQLR